MEIDGRFDMLQYCGLSAVLYGNDCAEMNLAGLGMQKEMSIERQKISDKSDVVMLGENI